MADSLVLTGVKQVTKHKGDEMTRLDYPRGGNSWHLKRWWVQGNGTVYVDCTVFKVEAGGESGYLAIKASPSVNLRIDHDGAFGFGFFFINEVERAALYNADWELVEHYVFPRISGGKVMTVIPPGAATKPGQGPAPTTIGTVTLNGEGAPVDGATESYTATITGDASDVVYTLASSNGLDTVAGMAVTFNGPGARTLTVTATSATASDSPQSGDLNAVVS